MASDAVPQPSAHASTYRVLRQRANSYAAANAEDADWTTVFKFYAALHLTQSYLLTKAARFNAKDHVERWKAIRAAPELGRRFQESYKKLRQISECVRYDAGYKCTDRDFKDSAAALETVESFLISKLRKNGVEVPD